MKPPHCRVCGEEGYGHVCRTMSAIVRTQLSTTEKTREPEPPIGNAILAVRADRVLPRLAPDHAQRDRDSGPLKLQFKHRDGSFDKNAYQRDYMRRRRANKGPKNG